MDTIKQYTNQWKLESKFRIFFSTAVILISSLYAAVFLMLPAIMIRPFFRKLAFQIHHKVASLWFRLVLFVFEVFNGIEVRYYGDEVGQGEAAILMMNHPSEVDWLFSYSIAQRTKSLSKIKVILKNDVRYVPGVGWGCDNLDYIFLSRDWAFDKSHIEYKLNGFKEMDFKPWIVIFPEGTDLDPVKLKKSWDYSEKNGFPKFNNVLLPRHKGLHAIVEPMRDRLDAVYDITIGYESKPSILSCISGTNPKVVNIHIKKILLKDIPTDEDKLQSWLFGVYKEKDALLQHLKENQTFPCPFKAPRPGLSILASIFIWFKFFIGPLTALIFYSTPVRIYFILAIIYYIFNSKIEELRKWRGLQKDVYKPKPKVN
ncbi:hypothetical protein CYY_005249 [Polysphondylium violaceum]|uniref:Phospholipid/glycerol acyltransferase domain-containing protein n=1 Tax=Polysphondylium violaceum TaxID=133409 RepID=A0A8J4PTT7_9MYCE|nr:hypothetical protein CYY_005249 [Polysphondylium violaceum]